MNELLTSVRQNALGLALFAFFTVGVIAITQVTTAERIRENVQKTQERALNEIISADLYDNTLLTDTLSVSEFDTRLLGPVKTNDRIHLARREGQVIALLLPVVAPDGYTQEIRMLVGVLRDGSIIGVRITQHLETPGLGDKIDIRKHDWVLSFNEKSLTHPDDKGWAVKKDGGEFDQFTGATITPRAVVRAVKHALQFVEQHRDALFNAPMPVQQAQGEPS